MNAIISVKKTLNRVQFNPVEEMMRHGVLRLVLKQRTNQGIDMKWALIQDSVEQSSYERMQERKEIRCHMYSLSGRCQKVMLINFIHKVLKHKISVGLLPPVAESRGFGCDHSHQSYQEECQQSHHGWCKESGLTWKSSSVLSYIGIDACLCLR